MKCPPQSLIYIFLNLVKAFFFHTHSKIVHLWCNKNKNSDRFFSNSVSPQETQSVSLDPLILGREEKGQDRKTLHLLSYHLIYLITFSPGPLLLLYFMIIVTPHFSFKKREIHACHHNSGIPTLPGVVTALENITTT